MEEIHYCFIKEDILARDHNLCTRQFSYLAFSCMLAVNDNGGRDHVQKNCIACWFYSRF